MNYELELHPRDVLYFRDGRPLGGSSDGIGSLWPHPALFHSALLAALQRRFADRLGEWESEHHRLTVSEQRKQERGRVRFHLGGLKSWGPFPKNDEGIWVSTPADLLVQGGVASPMQFSRAGRANLPEPLQYPVGSLAGATKEKPGEWLLLSELAHYLAGETKNLRTVSAGELYLAEARPGIGIDAERRSVEEGRFYSAEYLRLAKGVSMAAFASCAAKKYSGAETDMVAELFREGNRCDLIFGGQRGTARLECGRSRAALVKDPPESFPGNRVKWVLLSPGFFCRGWLPGWVDQKSGAVMLRENKSDAVGARLLAACIPQPPPRSGRNPAAGAPMATRLLVPAGAVYYFECGTPEDAQRLSRILHGRTKPDALGEQGLGLGVCGRWDFIQL